MKLVLILLFVSILAGVVVLGKGTLIQAQADDDFSDGPLFEEDVDFPQAPILSTTPHTLTEFSPQTTPFAPANLASSYTITPVLFLASDKTNQATDVSFVNDTFRVLRTWYSGQLQTSSAKTFVLNPAIIHYAPQVFDYYKCPNHIYPCGDNYSAVWGNVENELTAGGVPLLEPGNIHIIFVPGAGGFAGSLGCNNSDECIPGPHAITSTRGFAILGDWALDGIASRPNTNCTASLGIFCAQDPQRGAIGHELGHTFGLLHPDSISDTIMSTWWNFPFVSLLATEKPPLAPSQFFTSMPCILDSTALVTTMRKKVQTDRKFTAQTRLENSGLCVWPQSSVDLKIVKDGVWKIKKVLLTHDVYPAQYYDFIINLTSPTTPGVYSNFWQLESSGSFFGNKIGRKITVN